MKLLWSLVLIAACAGCNNQSNSPDSVRERAADATATLRREEARVEKEGDVNLDESGSRRKKPAA